MSFRRHAGWWAPRKLKWGASLRPFSLSGSWSSSQVCPLPYGSQTLCRRPLPEWRVPACRSSLRQWLLPTGLFRVSACWLLSGKLWRWCPDVRCNSRHSIRMIRQARGCSKALMWRRQNEIRQTWTLRASTCSLTAENAILRFCHSRSTANPMRDVRAARLHKNTGCGCRQDTRALLPRFLPRGCVQCP